MANLDKKVLSIHLLKEVKSSTFYSCFLKPFKNTILIICVVALSGPTDVRFLEHTPVETLKMFIFTEILSCQLQECSTFL